MTQDELTKLADDWIRYHVEAKDSPARETTAWATDLYQLEHHDPETLWSLILIIHANKSICTSSGEPVRSTSRGSLGEEWRTIYQPCRS